MPPKNNKHQIVVKNRHISVSLLAVRCYYGNYSACKTSSGKRNHLRLIYLLHLHLEIRAVLDFVLFGKLVPFKMPYMQFLFVRPRFCPQRHF